MTFPANGAEPGQAPLTHRSVLSIAVPVMISNVSTPLIGIVNTAIVGRYPNPVYIGAVAIGALILSLVFWAIRLPAHGHDGAHGASTRGR
jgi:MATE family multidrug resistance protein